jgi:DNA repair protein RadC
MENLDLFECKKFRSVYLAAETETEYTGEPITGSKEAADFFRPLFGDTILAVESIFALCLNSSLRPLSVSKISTGGLTATICEPIVVAKLAIDTLAKNVILCHNHPGGSTNASAADINISKKIKNTLDIFSCELADHIILTETDYFSMRGLY